MAIYIQEGKFIDYTPGGPVPAGTVVKLGDDYFAVALRDMAANQLGALATSGVFEVDTDVAINAGARVYWDADSKKVGTTPVDDYYFGRAVAAAAGGKVRVFLNEANIGDFTPIAAQSAPVATQAAIDSLTAADPAAISADVTDDTTAELIADVTAIRAEVIKAVADLATLKTAINAAKTDLAAVVAVLKDAAVLE